MSNTTPPRAPPTKTRELTTTTIKSPPFAYLHLSTSTTTPGLDALQVRSYCSSASRQFLGTTGAAIPVDVLSVSSGLGGGGDAWVRVPRADLGAFAGAITAFGGLSSDGGVMVMRVKACGDWLGSLVGGDGEERVWGSSS
ncbi:hypothetical protein B0T18DRAFT_313672 [Schizothecium vesticola]|uniref:Ribonucleases P/MRP subunit Pop8-like domain-containing protein n=1 Tax=Schizothecium vesticola TaxID=314040 RepID=A0AA40FBM0_9PEZI|nr:hypothetical protein B0T18DRAFT_313672 [Schizothecium vesticola]